MEVKTTFPWILNIQNTSELKTIAFLVPVITSAF